jgi:nuclear pore complex protein Nup85
MPPDPTDPEDMLHAALLNGELEQALVHAEKIDLWLAAHLADLMAPLGFLKTNPDKE